MSTDHERTTDQLCADAAIAEKARELMKAAQEMVRGAKYADKKMNRQYEPGSYITADRIVSIMKRKTDAAISTAGSTWSTAAV